MTKSVQVCLVILGLTAVLLDFAWGVECPPDSDESVYFPHETECGKFYECNGGQAKVFDCPAGTYFDDTLDVCNWDVNCGDLRTSTAPPLTSSTEPGPTEEPPTEEPPTEAPVSTEAQ